MTISFKPAQRLLCVLLVVFLLFASVLQPCAQAIAIADDMVYAGTVAIIAAVWIASGSGFGNIEDLWASCEHVYKKYIEPVPDLLSELTGLAKDWLGSAGQSIHDFGVKVSTRLWNAICGKPAKDEIVDGNIGVDRTFFLSEFRDFRDLYLLYPEIDHPTYGLIDNPMLRSDSSIILKDSSGNLGICSIDVSGVIVTCQLSLNGEIRTMSFDLSYDDFQSLDLCFVTLSVNYTSLGSCFIACGKKTDGSFGSRAYGLLSNSYYFPVEVTFCGVDSPISGTIAQPAEDVVVQLPSQIPTQDDTGKVVFPNIPLDQGSYQVNVGDIPATDIPEDAIVDLTTGEVLTETGTEVKPGTDTGEITGALGNIIGALGNITGAIGNILDAIVGFFDSPSDFKLNFDAFKDTILTDRFPFCIPFDLVNSVRSFAASAEDFVFKIDLDTEYWSVHHTVDLKPFALIIGFFRYTCVAWFTWVLITRTRDMIRW